MKLSLLAEDYPEMVRQLSAPYRISSSPRQFKKQDSLPGNQVGKGTLSAAVRYHQQHMNGKRWSVLEKAFTDRSATFQGAKGDFIRPRISLFTYLTNLRDPWPEGNRLARQLLVAVANGKLASSYSRTLFDNRAVAGWAAENLDPDTISKLVERSKTWEWGRDSNKLWNMVGQMSGPPQDRDIDWRPTEKIPEDDYAA